ncbi:MAG: M20/M25/M40 family metallo-hydrolase [Flavobacteriaceae bacterium]
MKKYSSPISFLLIIALIYWVFKASMPSYTESETPPKNGFSTKNAFEHVKNIAQEPHAVGFKAHSSVREYLMGQLMKLGLNPQLQEGYTSGDWGNFSKAINILSRIEGTGDGKALMLLSHYDSSPHSSYGASDAGSGVATILEGLRAFLEQNPTPANDIIILFTDAEELGLNGADLFVNKHPWAKDVGLVLNFEARGSGGPSYMLIETNRGNGKLIEEFIAAEPDFPVGNSLAYSIYKLLPNDTDLTVFREDRDIDGFNFAFIDDHYDYHTANDRVDRLDRNTLAHQGSYLMPLLIYFSQSDLNNLKSLNDYIYFNLPYYKLVTYPFGWIWPLVGLAVLFFIILIIYGFRKKRLSLKESLIGFIPSLSILIVNGLIGYFGWTALLKIYPHYADIQQGFTYNGHSYIIAFVLCSLAVCFYLYYKFHKIGVANLLVAPLVLWLVICWAMAQYLPGASFFIIPVFAMLLSFMMILYQEKPAIFLLLFLGIPALWIIGPFIEMFPVGLGMKMIITSTLFTSLLFFLLLGIFGFYKSKGRWAALALVVGIGFFVSAHLSSGFDVENPKPSSLLYVLNADESTARWATYEKVPSAWTSQYLDKDKQAPDRQKAKTISSKYSSNFTFVKEAPFKSIPLPIIEKSMDTVIGQERLLEICITPQRDINRLEIYTNDVTLNKAFVNGIDLGDYYLSKRKWAKLLTHYVSNNEFTELRLRIPKDSVLELTIYEASNDLLKHQQFSIPPRPADNIPMPFILNDAILVTKTVRFE